MSLSTRKSIVFSVILIVGTLFLVEVGVRLVAFVTYGFSSYFLTYGFRESYVEGAEGHSEMHNGYFKFPPSRTLRQYGLFREPTPIRINDRGFRGRDFSPKKSGFRVICMGGSSTFGFYNRDDHTYPALLERALHAGTARSSIEVLNAGIPHSTTSNIVAMLRGEIRQYHPDVVTFYEAFNDAGIVMDENWMQVAARWMHGHFATYVALKRVVAAVGGPMLHSKWATYLPQSNAAYIERQISLHVPRFERNLEAFVDVVRSIGAEPILIRQPITTKHSSDHPHGRPDRNLTYEQEVEWIRDNLRRHGWVSSIEALMLVHQALLETVDRVALKHRVKVVDNVVITDRHPEFFASYVHLTEQGNAALAAATADVIAPLSAESSRRPAGP
jgi:lysophospholipase L1-like esterase